MCRYGDGCNCEALLLISNQWTLPLNIYSYYTFAYRDWLTNDTNHRVNLLGNITLNHHQQPWAIVTFTAQPMYHHDSNNNPSNAKQPPSLSSLSPITDYQQLCLRLIDVESTAEFTSATRPYCIDVEHDTCLIRSPASSYLFAYSSLIQWSLSSFITALVIARNIVLCC